MFEAQRQHPVAAITSVLEIVKRNFISLLLLLFVTSGGESMISFYSTISVASILLVGGVLSWLRFTYRIVNGELRIEQGIFVRKNIYLSKERIQVIDIKAGILQRLFGLVEVEVKTAGSSSKQAKISAITKSKAEDLKEELRKDTGTVKKTDIDEVKERARYQLTGKELAIAAATSGSFGIALSIVGTVFSQVDQVLSEDQLIRYLEMLVPGSLSSNLIVGAILLVLIISWLLSFLGTTIRYFGFLLTVKDNELQIRHGLFEQRQITVPFNRIQAIQVKEGLLRQPFGYASLIIESAGYGEDQGNSTTLYPLIAKDRVSSFLNEVLPDYADGVVAKTVPQKAMKRYLFRVFRWSLVLILSAWWFLPYGWSALFLLLPAMMLGFAQYRDAGIGIHDRTLSIQSRLLSKKTAIVNRNRIQRVSLKQNPFQKRLGLLSYTVTVASGNQGRDFTIRELDKATAFSFFSWVSPSSSSPLSPLDDTLG